MVTAAVAPEILARVGLAVGGSALSGMATAIKLLYGVASDLNEYVDKHIDDMKCSDNPAISRTGRVLEMAKYGFGLGYMSSVAIIAVGQLLLGNTLSAISTVATAATLSNPIAMTCAAIGAIVYGWGALSDQERNDILEKLATGLDIGVELIKAIVNFVIEKTKELLDSKVVKELKEFIADKASLFGRSLSDVTHSTVDAINDAAMVVKKHANNALIETRRVAEQTAVAVSDVIDEGVKVGGDAVGRSVDAVGDAARKTLERGRDLVQRSRVEPPPK